VTRSLGGFWPIRTSHPPVDEDDNDDVDSKKEKKKKKKKGRLFFSLAMYRPHTFAKKNRPNQMGLSFLAAKKQHDVMSVLFLNACLVEEDCAC